MKKISFNVASYIAATTTKVNPAFVESVKEAFLMLPKSVTMRYKQNALRQLIISLVVTYKNGMKQHFEGAADVELISVILSAMGGDNTKWIEYSKQERDIEVAADDEDMVLELFKQYFASLMQRFVESDWYSATGKRYRQVTFVPFYNMNVKFTLEATDEVNNLILEACKSERMKKAYAEVAAKAEVENLVNAPDAKEVA